MSHVDEGELTAYADGAYPADHPDAQNITAHLKECVDCRTRLEQLESLRGRAAAILAHAAPANLRVPDFETLQQETPKKRPRQSIPLAWAATIVLAAGLGWFGRGMWQYQPRTEDMVSMSTPEPAAPAAELQTQTPSQTPPAPPASAPQQADARVGTGQSATASAAAPATAARRQAQRSELAQAAVEELESDQGAITGSAAASDMARPAQTVAPPAAPPAPAPTTANAERPLVLRQVQLPHPAIAGLPIKSVLTEGDTTIVEQLLPDGKTIRLTIMAAATQMREAGKTRAANDVAQESTASAAGPAPVYVTVTLGNRLIQVQGAVSGDSLRALARQIK